MDNSAGAVTSENQPLKPVNRTGRIDRPQSCFLVALEGEWAAPVQAFELNIFLRKIYQALIVQWGLSLPLVSYLANSPDAQRNFADRWKYLSLFLIGVLGFLMVKFKNEKKLVRKFLLNFTFGGWLYSAVLFAELEASGKGQIVVQALSFTLLNLVVNFLYATQLWLAFDFLQLTMMNTILTIVSWGFVNSHGFYSSWKLWSLAFPLVFNIYLQYDLFMMKSRVCCFG